MAVTIIATPKATDANSYITLADANTYFDGRLDVSNWTSATDDTKNRALVMATNRLEQEDWHGAPTDSEQRLKWPRSGLTDLDGRNYDQDEIPRPIEEAVSELALTLVTGDLELKDSGLEGFEQVQVGSLTVRPRAGHQSGQLPDQVLRLLRGLRAGATGMNVPITRG